MNELVSTEGGLISGRQMCSPLPVHIASPSLSWISGRQSVANLLSLAPYQNMLVSGAIPRRATSVRANSSAVTSITAPRGFDATNR